MMEIRLSMVIIRRVGCPCSIALIRSVSIEVQTDHVA